MKGNSPLIIGLRLRGLLPAGSGQTCSTTDFLRIAGLGNAAAMPDSEKVAHAPHLSRAGTVGDNGLNEPNRGSLCAQAIF